MTLIRNIALMTATLLTPNLSLACFGVCDDVIVQDSMEFMHTARGFLEHFMHLQNDTVKFFRHKIKQRFGRGIPLTETLAMQRALEKVISASEASLNIANVARILLDFVIDFRLHGNNDKKAFFDQLDALIDDSQKTNNDVSHLMLVELSTKAMYERKEHFSNTNYFSANIDIDIITFLKDMLKSIYIARTTDMENFQKKFDDPAYAPHERALYKSLKDESTLQALIDSISDFGDLFHAYVNNTGSLLTRFVLQTPQPRKAKNRRNRSRKGRNALSIASLPTTPSTITPQALPQAAIDEESEGVDVKPSSEAPVAMPCLVDNTVTTDNSAVGEPEEGDASTNYAPQERWWLGYELEKKIHKRQVREKKHSSAKGKEHAQGMDDVESEEIIVDRILNQNKHVKSFSLLQKVLLPGKEKLKVLPWTHAAKLLSDLHATIDSRAAGSRNTVALNGIKTVFHTHGTLGKDTINSHLKNFLITSLSAGK